MEEKVPLKYRAHLPIKTWSSAGDGELAEAPANDLHEPDATTRHEARQAIFDAVHALAQPAIDRLALVLASAQEPPLAELDRWGQEQNMDLGDAVWDIYLSWAMARTENEPLRLKATKFVSGVRFLGNSGETIFSARINPREQTMVEARRAIRYQLDRELERIYEEDNRRQAQPNKGRRHFRRNATRFVLRQLYDCPLIEIVYYEEGRTARCSNGRTLEKQDFEGQCDDEELDDEWEIDDVDDSEEYDISETADRRRVWALEKSIRAIADQAGIGLAQRLAGSPRKD